MTTTFENSKGYKVLPLSADEIKVWPRAKTCDRCGRKISSNGFYVGAVNLMYCPDCYEEWHASAPENREFWISGKYVFGQSHRVYYQCFLKNKSRIKVHRSTRKQGLQTYYFTKDAKHCVCIEYDPTLDLGMILRPALDCLE